MLCDNPFHYETICTGLQTRTVIKGFGDLHATIAPNRMCEQMRGIEPPSPTWKEGVMNHYTTSAKQKTPTN